MFPASLMRPSVPFPSSQARGTSCPVPRLFKARGLSGELGSVGRCCAAAPISRPLCGCLYPARFSSVEVLAHVQIVDDVVRVLTIGQPLIFPCLVRELVLQEAVHTPVYDIFVN